MTAALTVPLVDFEIPYDVAILGLITGLTYGLLAVGLVLVYKTTRVLNFAHGEMGSLAATLVPALVLGGPGLGYGPALVLALVVAVAAGAAMELIVVRRLRQAPRLVLMVATIGAAQLYFALNAGIPKPENIAETFPVPFDVRVRVGHLTLGTGHLLILVVAPVLALLVAAFLRYTKLGLASRAAADNHDAARLTGIPVRRVHLTMWALAGLLAGGAAILVGPTQPVAVTFALGPNLMLRGLGAAMIAGLDSLPRAFVGGVGIGLVEALILWNYPVGGVLEFVLLALIVVSLLVSRRLRATARSGDGTSWSLAGSAARLPRALAAHPSVRLLRVAGLAGLLALAALAPLPLSAAQRVLLSSIVCFAVMGLSLTVLTGLAGQVSFGQFAFVGLGALVGSRMSELGYPPWAGCLYATIAGGVAATIVGIPALRIRGLFLAVVTLGFGIAAQQWLFQQDWLVGQRSGIGLQRPSLGPLDFQDEATYYYLCLAALVGVAALVHRLPTTGIGRAFAAVRDNEACAAGLGISPRAAKLLAFAMSGMIAAFAGYLYGGLLVQFSPATFTPELSLALVGMVVFGGVTTVTGAVVGALWVRGAQWFLAPLFSGLGREIVTVMVGGIGLLVILLLLPGGVADLLFRLRDRLVRRVAGTESRRAGPAAPGAARRPLPPAPIREPSPTAPDAPVPVDVPALEALGLRVSFGGNLAVAGADLRARRGEVVGLLGPNGAGKTTLFELLSGHVAPDAGTVLLHGEDVTSLRPEQRARLGLGRTFQQARLFDDLTVVDTLRIALERHEATEVVPAVLGLPPARRSERRKAARADELVELLGLGPFADRRIRELSTGTRRFVELGTIVALGADVLLLDEPTAGIAQREVEAFRPVLRELRDHLDATVLLIEHDIPLVMAVADRVYVLAAGAVLAEGPPEVVRDDPAVVAAYLGTDERVIQRSGAAALVGAG